MRNLIWGIPLAGALAMTGFMVTSPSTAADAAKAELHPVTGLPVTQVMMFSSGVGYFARSAEVEGNTRVDLTFQERDINDLLKSMVLQDFGKGQIAAVSYDSREPISRTLSSFAINLDNNPTFANILNQARGEQVEVVLQQNVAAQPGNIKGSIMSVEQQKIAGKDGAQEVDVLNLWCVEGMRAVKLNELQRLRFVNPVIENEVRRALETLATNHDQQKKAVSLHFVGQGKRKVQVGYVIENPLWKTSYRLVLDKERAPFLQGWAIVENPTDEDWNAVNIVLISGRPISFKMDLYNPLYVPRPTVEPELFASLRPPTYSGDMLARDKAVPEAEAAMGGFGGGGGSPGNGFAKGEAQDARADGRQLRAAMAPPANPLNDEQRKMYVDKAKQNMNGRMELGATPNAATASALGDSFQYIIEQPVDLGRQKSALLPIINSDIDAARVSIYNQSVQAKHPLLGLKIKNNTKYHLMQGPITVFEGSTYAGDTRVLDVQPNEERLVSYAIDLGTEVDPTNSNNTSRITNIKAVKGIVYTTTRLKEEKIYRIANRSTLDRTVLIEHPNRTNQQFKVTSAIAPIETASDVYRFESKVAAGKNTSFTVTEERDQGTAIQINNSNDDQIRILINLNEASAGLKAALQKSLVIKGEWDVTRREIGNVERGIQTITVDQNRLRQNLREMPKEAEAYTTYLKKFDVQEKEMDKLMQQLKTLQAEEFTKRTAYETYLLTLTIE